MSLEDLKTYKPKWRKVLKGNFKGHDILSMPPPSSGGVHLIQMMNMVEKSSFNHQNFYDTQNIHQLTQIMQFAYHDRAKYLGDTDFVTVPIKGLKSKKYAEKLLTKFSNKALSAKDFSDQKPMKYESNETTHFTIVDTEGFIVSSTQTINGPLGSAFVAGSTGVVMNNEMDDFSIKPGFANFFGAIGNEQNAIASKKRPLSSMTPTIILKDQKFHSALGTPNGTRIISCVFLTMVGLLEFNKTAQESLKITRFHHQWKPDYLRVDAPNFSQKLTEDLKSLGYNVQNKPYGCKVQLVHQSLDGLRALSDPRGLGSAEAF